MKMDRTSLATKFIGKHPIYLVSLSLSICFAARYIVFLGLPNLSVRLKTRCLEFP